MLIPPWTPAQVVGVAVDHHGIVEALEEDHEPQEEPEGEPALPARRPVPAGPGEQERRHEANREGDHQEQRRVGLGLAVDLAQTLVGRAHHDPVQNEVGDPGDDAGTDSGEADTVPVHASSSPRATRGWKTAGATMAPTLV